MAAKPVIGINMDFRSSCKEHASLSFIAAGYYENIIQSGGIPLVLPPLEDEDDLEDEEGDLLELLDILPVLGGIEPLLNRGRVKFADMVGDEGEVTRTQGVQTKQDQVIKRAEGNCGHDHNLLEDVILLLAYHSYHRFSALDSEHISKAQFLYTKYSFPVLTFLLTTSRDAAVKMLMFTF